MKTATQLLTVPKYKIGYKFFIGFKITFFKYSSSIIISCTY